MKWEESTDHTERLTFHENGTATVIRYNMMTGKFNKAIISITSEQYYRWNQRRELIQDVMPNISKEEREFLMTGYTPDDWEKMFPKDEEDAD